MVTFFDCLLKIDQIQPVSILFNLQATMLLEYLCLFIFILRLFHVWCAAGVQFWRDKNNVILLAIIVVRYFFNLYYMQCECITSCDSRLLLLLLLLLLFLKVLPLLTYGPKFNL